MHRQDMSAYVKRLEEKYKDREFGFPYDFCQSNSLNKMAFMIITPDAVRRNIYNEIIEYLYYEKKYKFLMCKIVMLSAYQIEELYKYSFKRKIINNEPSYWWLMERCLQVGPSLVILIYNPLEMSGYFSENLTILKGEYKKQEDLKEKETIRVKFSSMSRLLNNIHCSDDIFQTIREANIFFTYSEIKHALYKAENGNFMDVKILSNMLRGGDKATRDYKMIINEIEGKIISQLAIIWDKGFDETRLLLQQGDLLQVDKLLLDESCNRIQDRLVFLYNTFTTSKCTNIYQIVKILDADDVPLSDFEKNIILNRVVFSKYNEYEYA